MRISEGKITIKVQGAERTLALNSFRAMRTLGMKGPADSAGLEAALTNALQDWDGLAALLSAGGVTLKSHEDLDDWTLADMRELCEAIPKAFGLGASVVQEGEQSGPPAESRSGLSVVPLPDTISV